MRSGKSPLQDRYHVPLLSYERFHSCMFSIAVIIEHGSNKLRPEVVNICKFCVLHHLRAPRSSSGSLLRGLATVDGSGA